MTRVRFVLAALALLAACGGGGNGEPTAEDAIDAFRDAGLSIPNPRDNSHGCGDLPCKALISTDAFSVYEWNNEAAARDWADSTSRPVLRNGTLTLGFATGGSAVKVDPDPYEAVFSGL